MSFGSCALGGRRCKSADHACNRHPASFLFSDSGDNDEEEESPQKTYTPDEPYRDNNDDDQQDQDNATLFASQQNQMSTQDRHLDTLSQSISRQHTLSMQMNEELELQNELLGDLDSDVERTGLRLGRASGQLDRVKRGLKDHGGCA